MTSKKLDLFKNQYDRQTLKDHLYDLDVMDILRTQVIDASFAVKYIMNPKYDLDDQYTITADLILHYQPHLTRSEILVQLLQYESDQDSVDDFETVSLRQT